MSAHEHAKPIGGTILDPLMKKLLALFALAAVVTIYRFAVGIGPVSNMTDGFTWGIWEPVNVVVFTGIGAGAFSVGLLTYALNQGKYHGLVRPAVLVGAISYTLGATSIAIALGRPWNSYWIPWLPYWNLSSNLLEVAVCVMAYVCVLWIEVLPAIFEGASKSASPKWSRVGKEWGPRLDKAMPFFIAAAIVLPSMHQSSLGGLMLIAGPKIHPLWHNGLLPTLYLISCLGMGFGAVVMLTNLLKVSWNGKADQSILAGLCKANAIVLGLYSVLRLGEIVVHGKLRFLGGNWPTFFFLLEMALFIAPAVMFLMPSVQGDRGKLFLGAFFAVFAGAMYRVNTYMTMYRPAGWKPDGSAWDAGWQYFPSLGESIVTIGMAAVGVAVFIAISRQFPVVVVEDRAHSNIGGAKAAASR